MSQESNVIRGKFGGAVRAAPALQRALTLHRHGQRIDSDLGEFIVAIDGREAVLGQAEMDMLIQIVFWPSSAYENQQIEAVLLNNRMRAFNLYRDLAQKRIDLVSPEHVNAALRAECSRTKASQDVQVRALVNCLVRAGYQIQKDDRIMLGYLQERDDKGRGDLPPLSESLTILSGLFSNGRRNHFRPE